PNPVELFQIWMNLPADDKLVEPHFSMLWDHDIPRVTTTDGEGRGVEVTVIAGTLAGASAPPPPPHSWASRPDSDVAIWHVVLEAGASFELPAAASDETVRTLYVFEGDGLDIAGEAVGARTGNVVRATQPVVVTAPASGAEVLVLQGRPIGEPVAQYGPFVMNDRAGIEQAFADYQRTGFGGWPWPADDPNHGPDRGRFARHADGRLEEVG
ncbi:MAG: pirin family protein, partial [Acidimicrobiales bacterium]|nr:pirin family protein [Acidimicrobiales bacterium]